MSTLTLNGNRSDFSLSFVTLSDSSYRDWDATQSTLAENATFWNDEKKQEVTKKRFLGIFNV